MKVKIEKQCDICGNKNPSDNYVVSTIQETKNKKIIINFTVACGSCNADCRAGALISSLGKPHE